MKTTMYKTLVIVEGAGTFPMDMLRYDSCIPNTERDSYKMRDEAVATRRVGFVPVEREQRCWCHGAALGVFRLAGRVGG